MYERLQGPSRAMSPRTPPASSRNPTSPDSPSKNLRSRSSKAVQQTNPSAVLVSPVKIRGKRIENTTDAEVWDKDDDEIIGINMLTSNHIVTATTDTDDFRSDSAPNGTRPTLTMKMMAAQHKTQIRLMLTLIPLQFQRPKSEQLEVCSSTGKTAEILALD